jgi:hypothetical protein
MEIIEACSEQCVTVETYHFFIRNSFMFYSYQPFAAETARVMLKNLSAKLCVPARLSAAASFVPLMKALLPDHKVPFWEDVKKRLDERLAIEGESEVLIHFFIAASSCVE